MPRILIENIIRQLKELQDGSVWFDQCFNDKLSGLTDVEAFTKPLPELHSIAEQVSHILAWRKECILMFSGSRTNLMNSPEDWKTNNDLKRMGWGKLKTALNESKNELIHLLDNKTDEYLDTMFMDTENSFHYLIEGIIQHDIYHLGQIGICIKLLSKYKVQGVE
jgi:uncharacterized damage-inducible protein DinB